ncbi:IPT/TIG domain-containing protein [Rathayibacter sp. KR2-224]|uniref:IPT/TIG domain-containing protein n=1 Tax=Rathayibacter sp. KR2-224 TaxID=3400913 RepID=UPI003C028433
MNVPAAYPESDSAGQARRDRGRPRHRRPQWRKRVVKWTAALGTGLLMSTGALAAIASPGDSSTSSGTFLSGSLLSGIPLGDVAGLGGASATNPGNPTPVTDTSTLDLTALNAVTVSLPGGLDVPFGQLIQLGAVNQYAQASDGGVSRAASGAVGNDGAVDLSGSGTFPADATVDLTQLLGSQTALSAANLNAGAVTGVAALGGNGASPATSCTDISNPLNCRDYNIANAGLNLTSPLVGQLVTSVNGTLDTASTTVDGLASTLNSQIVTTVTGLIGALSGGADNVTVSINADLRTALASVLSGTLTQGGVSLNLSNGNITVDLAQVIGGISNRSPNTPLLSADVINTIVGDVNGILGQLQTNINTTLASALDAVAVTIGGGLCVPAGCATPVTGGELDLAYNGTIGDLASGNAHIAVTGTGLITSLLAPILNTLTSALGTALAGVVTPVRTSVINTVGTAVSTDVTTLTTALDPVLTSIGTVIGATLNVQEAGTAANSYREVALRVSLLSGAGATVDLGRAEVGPNAAVPASITSIVPNHGPQTGGTSVTITGSGFTAATGVTFDGVAGTNFTIVDDGHITVTTPVHAPGAVDVVVQSPNGDSAPGAFTFDPVPSISGLAPTSGPETGGTVVTITGTGFADATGVTFDGVAGTVFTPGGDTSITVTTPPHAPGAVDVIVQSPNGDSAPGTFTYTPVTKVDGVDPGSGPEAGGNTVTITGQCFTGATAVLFGGTPATSFSVDSDVQITAVVPAGTGAVDVSVVGAGTCGTGTDPGAYDYVATPAIASLAPDHGPQTGGTVVTITGTGFTNATGVTFDGTAGIAFDVVDATTIHVTSPAHVPGAVDVVVTDPLKNSAPATYTFDPVVQITAVSPNSGPETGGTPVTISGQCFTTAQDVLFGGTPATDVTVVDDSTITAVTPVGTGAVSVQVSTQGCGTATLPDAFTYVAPGAPVIQSLAPDHGPETGGTVVTINGTGFAGATGVTFDGVAGTALHIVNDTQLTVTTPAHVPAGAQVVVTSPVGPSAPGTFTFQPVTRIDSLNPSSGPETGGLTVTITGQCFTGASEVLFGGTAGTGLVVNSDSQLTVVSPPGTGTVDVTVVGAGTCGSATDNAAFTYVPAPTIQSLVPTEGPTAGGTSVTITGTNFNAATAVEFGGVAAASYFVDSATQITAVTPAHSAGSVNVTVTTLGGTSEPGTFTFVPPAAIISIVPDSGPETGGTTVTITGTGFAGATGVTFDGVPAGSFTPSGDTSITVTTPPHAPGPVDVIVQSTFGDSPAGTFTYEPATTITGVSPNSGPEHGGTQVTITGHCFTGASAVLFGETAVTSFTVVDDTTITATTPAGVGVVDVTVVGSESCGTGEAPGAFTYTTAPIIYGLTPIRGPEVGGTVVTITGANFDGATGATFDGLAGTSFTVNSDTQITVTSPAHVPSTVDVIVIGPDVQAGPSIESFLRPLLFAPAATNSQSNAGRFTYYAVTDVHGVDPGSGPTSGGTTVTISGHCFTGATQVLFGDTASTSFTVVNDTTITAVTPAGTGKVDVTVVGAGDCGTSSLRGAFTYVTATQALAATGAATLGIGGALAALGMLAAGIVLMFLRRRREV